MNFTDITGSFSLLLCVIYSVSCKEAIIKTQCPDRLITEEENITLCACPNSALPNTTQFLNATLHRNSSNSNYSTLAISLLPAPGSSCYCTSHAFDLGSSEAQFELFNFSVPAADFSENSTLVDSCWIAVLNKNGSLKECAKMKEYCFENASSSTLTSLAKVDLDCLEDQFGDNDILSTPEQNEITDCLENFSKDFFQFTDTMPGGANCTTRCANLICIQSNSDQHSTCKHVTLVLSKQVPIIIRDRFRGLQNAVLAIVAKCPTITISIIHVDCCEVNEGVCVPTTSPLNEGMPTLPLNKGVIIGGALAGLAVAILLSLMLPVYMCRRTHATTTAINKKHETDCIPEARCEVEHHDNPTYAQELPHFQGQEFTRTCVSEVPEKGFKWKNEFTGNSIRFSQLDTQEILGEGEFGKVHRGRLITTNKQDISTTSHDVIEVAIKSLKSTNVTVQEIEDFLAESLIMLDFNHPNVMKLVGVCFDTDNDLPLIILPYMANRDLKSFLKSKRMNPSCDKENFPKGLSEAILIKMCLDIAQGMEYLSRSKFVHRDLAARNCMVDGRLTVCVSDFGLSRDIFYSDYYRLTHTARLPIKWMAPESLCDHIYNEKTDVWSFGVVCWEVFSLGCTPFPGVDNADILDHIERGNRLRQPDLCPNELYQVMQSMWNLYPEERPTFLHTTVSLTAILHDAHFYFTLEQDDHEVENSYTTTNVVSINA